VESGDLMRYNLDMKRVLTLACIGIFSVVTNAQFQAPPDIPAYNAAPPPKIAKMNPIMPREYRKGEMFSHAAQTESYKQAEQIASVLYQLPCYCYCDRGHGHNSLRSCFESEHGAMCGICMQEELYAYKQVKAGKSVKQIRASIIKGDYKTIDLDKVIASK
jgi:hypothetical protein